MPFIYWYFWFMFSFLTIFFIIWGYKIGLKDINEEFDCFAPYRNRGECCGETAFTISFPGLVFSLLILLALLDEFSREPMYSMFIFWAFLLFVAFVSFLIFPIIFVYKGRRIKVADFRIKT